ncbi:uncharacterized protein LOC112575695 [Pomacea canaliculata]|uniref:uncharacterized protein LOC112575695 n=1 Tax=Pomacea canaliculata TaxID=400727 RepID=UPI000D73581F|nr:uncharacterized protein LOC112575695 [Pomacea canaliculata]
MTSYTMEGGGRSRDFYTSSTSFPLRLIMSTLLLSFQISLNSRALAQAKTKASCNISSVKENEPAALTCVFSSDISVTKDNFEVVRPDGKGSNVASCTWTNGELECTTATGFDVNKTVTDHVIIRLSQATPAHTGQYACRLQGSDDGGFTHCDFVVMPGDPHDDSSAGVAAAVVIPLLVLIVLVAAILFVLWRKGKITRTQPSSPKRKQRMSREYKRTPLTRARDAVKESGHSSSRSAELF